MIHLKSHEEIEKIHTAGRILAEALKKVSQIVSPGITTEKLDKTAAELVKKQNARCAFYGYRGYPKNICVSVNEEVVHGIPGARKLKEGDIVGIDIGVELDGFFADAAITIGVGRISQQAEKLIEITKKALHKAIDVALLGNKLFDISYAIQQEAEASGFSVVRDLVGHGTGLSIHEDPQVPNFGLPHMGPILKEGMVLAIEPMINLGGYKVEILKDGWTYVTADRSLSAHFEHTIAITGEGPKILTE